MLVEFVNGLIIIASGEGWGDGKRRSLLFKGLVRTYPEDNKKRERIFTKS